MAAGRRLGAGDAGVQFRRKLAVLDHFGRASTRPSWLRHVELWRELDYAGTINQPRRDVIEVTAAAPGRESVPGLYSHC